MDSYSLVAALTGIMAQRLVRTICLHCAAPADDSESYSIYAALSPSDAGDGKELRKAVGCPHCRGTGYRGRAAIAETLSIDDEMKDLLVQRPPISSVKRLAREKGFRSLRQSAASLALRGLTTVEEVNRVAPVE